MPNAESPSRAQTGFRGPPERAPDRETRLAILMGGTPASKFPLMEEVNRTPQSTGFAGPLLASAFVLVAAWFLMPITILLNLRLPAYAWFHEPIGVRFFEAWLPLHEHSTNDYITGNYPLVIVGWIMDLFHRGILFVLIQLGYDPRRDFVRTMTAFANMSILIQSSLMIVVSGIIALGKRTRLVTRLSVLVAGASLGYAFYWSPIGLFIADFPLTRLVLVYSCLAFVVVRIVSLIPADSPIPPSQRVLLWRAISIGLFAAAMLLLEPTLLPYVVLLFIVGVVDLSGSDRWKVVRLALGVMCATLGGLWLMILGVDPIRAFQAALSLVRILGARGSVEPHFHLHDFVTPGTTYFLHFLASIAWLALPILTFVHAEDRRLRIIPLVGLLGLFFFAYVLIFRRPGNVLTEEGLVYMVATGTVCAALVRPTVRRALLIAWCVALITQTYLVARTALPATVSGARASAKVALEVDQYARSFGLPILYVYLEHGPDAYNMFQSAESAAFKGVQLHAGICSSGDCTLSEQSGLISLVVSPYRMVGEPKAIPTTPLVLLFANPEGGIDISRENPVVAQAVRWSTACREWEVTGWGWEVTSFQIHVCRIGQRD